METVTLVHERDLWHLFIGGEHLQYSRLNDALEEIDKQYKEFEG